MIRLWRSKESDVVCHGACYQEDDGRVKERRKERRSTVSVAAAAGDFHFSLLWTSAHLPRAPALHVTCRHGFLALDVWYIVHICHQASKKYDKRESRAIREAVVGRFRMEAPGDTEVFGRMHGEAAPRSRFNDDSKATIRKWNTSGLQK